MPLVLAMILLVRLRELITQTEVARASLGAHSPQGGSPPLVASTWSSDDQRAASGLVAVAVSGKARAVGARFYERPLTRTGSGRAGRRGLSRGDADDGAPGARRDRDGHPGGSDVAAALHGAPVRRSVDAGDVVADEWFG